MSADTLHQAIAAARDGRRDDARILLMHVLETDPCNERAWLWLSGVVDDPGDVKICLENVLALNPSNARARQGLEWLHAQVGLPLPPSLSPERSGSTEREIDTVALSLTRLRAYRATLADVAAVEESARQSVQSAPAPARQSVQSAPAPSRAAVQSSAPAPHHAPAPSATRLTALETDDNTTPCPYCGAPTVEAQHRCTQCRGNLMVRVAPSDEQSPVVLALVWLWRGGAIATLLIALVFPALGVFVYQENPARGFPIGILIPSVLLALMALIGLSVARQLAQRSVWALYLAVGLTIAGLIGALALVIRPEVMIDVMGRLIGAGILPPDVMAPLQSGVRVAAIGALVAHFAAIALTIAGYDHSVGKLKRFRHIVKISDHVTHYNYGVALKNRGMWYAASLEWEWSVKKAPYDVTYLRALGLAYAQLKQFDKARVMLDRALQVAPDQSGLAEDRALIERLVSRRER